MRTLRRFQRDWIVLGLIVVTLALTSCRAKNDAASGAGESATTGAEGQVATPGEQQAAAKLPPNPAAPCAPGSRCLKVGDNGALNPAGTSLAQCLGTYPDYVVPATLIPAGYAGPWFVLAQAYPTTPPPPHPLPWEAINFASGVKEANDYLYALRDYSFDGMITADFRPQDNTKRKWYHVPMMNFGPGRREFIHGVTQERTLKGPELGLKPGVSVSNFAVGFYNDIGASALGGIFKTSGSPDLSKSSFPAGSMVFKILFSAAKATDFQDPANDPLDGAPEWQIATATGMLKVRLMQMDVAARDDRAKPSGWVFGTFAFDRKAVDPIAWNRLRPVGLMWGNDPGYTPADQAAGKKLKESIVSDQIPAYAKTHLGWAGRVNGPVDNPISACLSCHSTAQYTIDAALAPFAANCNTDTKKLHWFRNFAGNVPFGAVDSTTCLPKTVTPPARSLDLSLQVQVAVQSMLQFHDVNSCQEVAGVIKAHALPESVPQRSQDVPRVSRDGFFEGH